MKNPVLDRIKAFAIKELTAAYGYCGLAEGDNMAMLNSDDGNGKDIKININSKSEEEVEDGYTRQEADGGYTDDDGGNLPNG